MPLGFFRVPHDRNDSGAGLGHGPFFTFPWPSKPSAGGAALERYTPLRDEGSKVEVVRADRRLDWGGTRADV